MTNYYFIVVVTYEYIIDSRYIYYINAYIINNMTVNTSVCFLSPNFKLSNE